MWTDILGQRGGSSGNRWTGSGKQFLTEVSNLPTVLGLQDAALRKDVGLIKRDMQGS